MVDRILGCSFLAVCLLVRRAAYWDVFAGGFGHTYGHRSYVLWARNGEDLGRGADVPWHKVLDAEGAAQMRHLRGVMESRPFLTRIPDQSVISAGEREGMERAVATRDEAGGYAMVYLPAGQPVTVRLDKLRGAAVRAQWFDPRRGESVAIGSFPARGSREFAPPRAGRGNDDWVLVLEAVTPAARARRAAAPVPAAPRPPSAPSRSPR